MPRGVIHCLLDAGWYSLSEEGVVDAVDVVVGAEEGSDEVEGWLSCCCR